MSPALSMASTTASTSLTDSNQYYASKYGRIAIFTGDNYAAFASTCRTALVVAGAWAIVDGAEDRPAGAGAGRRDWDERNRKAIQLISSSVSAPFQPRITDGITDEDAQAMWIELAKEDRATNKIHQANLFFQFNQAIWKPQTESIRTFQARLEEIRAQLANTERAISENDMMWRIISAIPDDGEWRQARQFCLQDNVDLTAVITTLQSYERPITDTNGSATPAATAAIADSRGSQRPTDRFTGRRGSARGRGRGRGYGRGIQKRGGGSIQSKGDKCFFCDKPGHFRRDCIKYKAAKEALNKRGDEHVNTVVHFSQSEPNSSLYTTEYALVTNSDGSWAVDSGATRHYSGFTGDFTTLKRWATPRTVRTADGSIFEALGSGNIELRTTYGSYILRDAWYTPQFSCRLVSTAILNDDGIVVTLENRNVRATSGPNIVFTGSGRQGLYYINLRTDSALAMTSTVSSTDIGSGILPITQSLRELWHNRLGHVSYKTLEKMPEHAEGISFRKITSAEQATGEIACESCLAGCMKESFSKKTDSRAKGKLVRLHCDISGIQVESIRGYRYYLLVTDDATRCTWIRYLKGKSAQDCVPVFKQLVSELEHEASCKIIYVRADNGKGEFGAEFQSYLAEKHITLEPSPAFKHSLNGVVERAMGVVKKIARSILYRATLSERLWCYATEHAVYLKNRLLTAALPWGDSEAHTPLQAFTDRKPNLGVLRVWGCAAYPLNSLERMPRTWDPRTRGEHVFIGLKGNKIWKFLNLETLREEVSADVQFHEFKFPIIAENANGQLLRRKPALAVPTDTLRSPKYSTEASGTKLRLLEHSTEASRTELRTTDVVTDRISSEKRIREAQAPGNSASTEYSGRNLPVRSADDPTGSAKVRGEAVEPARGSRGVMPAPGVSRREALEAPELPGGRTAPPNRELRTKGLDSAAVFKRTRSGRVPKLTVFTDSVARLVTELQAVHIEGDSSSIEVPAAPFESITLEEAMQEDAPAWKAALLSELESLKNTSTFLIVRIPENRRVIRSRWVLRKKLDANGDLARRKARVVIKGFEQQYGLDYFATFASVAKFNTLRILLTIIMERDLDADHIDVDTAYLNSDLKEEIYMELPEYFELLYPNLPAGVCLRLLKSLYGLKQAPREWFQEVNSFFSSIGFHPTDADPNLFVRNGVYILLYVDDMLIAGRTDELAAVKLQIAAKWKCKDLGPVTTFVGFQITRNRAARTLVIHQNAYITRLLERFKLDKANPTKLPIPANTILKLDLDLLSTDENQPLQPVETTIYRQAVGCMIYLSNCTRPDISYPVGQLARHMHDPRITHLRLVKQALRYLNGTRNLGIKYSFTGQKSNPYDLYSDATWGSESDRVSFQGWVVTRSGGAVSWTSQRQRSTALSSMEAEFIAASEAAKEAAWLEKLNTELDDKVTEPPTLRSDNTGAVTLIHDPKFHARSKHIDTRYMFIRNDLVAQNRLKVEHIPGRDQPADILTKQLPVDAMQRHMQTLGMG
jgi:hypothetical protein